MSMAFMYGQDSDGAWRPLRVNTAGDLGGGSEDRRPTRWSYAAAAGGITDTADLEIAAAPAAGYSHYLTSLQVANKSGTATEVVVKTGSTVLWRGFAPANGVQISANFDDEPLAGANATSLTAACVTNATATLINAQGFTDVNVSALAARLTTGEEIFADDGTLLTDDSGNTLYMT